MAADPAKRIAARDEEIPDRVYFRPGANMPRRREAPGLESAGRIDDLLVFPVPLRRESGEPRWKTKKFPPSCSFRQSRKGHNGGKF